MNSSISRYLVFNGILQEHKKGFYTSVKYTFLDIPSRSDDILKCLLSSTFPIHIMRFT